MTTPTRRTRRASRWLLAVACCAGLGPAAAQELIAYTFSFEPSIPRAQAIAPGAEGTLSVTVRNNTTGSGFAAIHGRINPDPAVLAEYAFESDTPDRCLPADIVTQLGYPSIRLRLGPLVPGATQTCNYRVRRAAASRNDLRFSLCGPLSSFPHCDYNFHFGTLPALRFQAAQVGQVEPGAATAMVRLTIDNPGPRAVLRRTLTTACAEFGGGLFAPAPFEVETDFAGGCPRAEFGEICLNFTGQNFDSRAFAPGPIPAGGSTSCLVRLRFTAPLTQPVSLAMHFHEEVVPFADGGIGYDPGSDLPTAPFGAAPATAVPTGRTGLAILALLLALVAGGALRNARGIRGPGARPC